MLLLFFKGSGLDTHDGGHSGDEYKKKRRKKSMHRVAEEAIDKALAKAASDARFRKGPKLPDIWHAEPLPEIEPLLEPTFDPRLVALADPLAAIRADLARINEMKRREEEDIELLLMSI